MNTGKFWTKDEEESLIKEFENKPFWISLNKFCVQVSTPARSAHAISAKLNNLRLEGKLKEGKINQSPYPIYNEPLVMEGNALIMADLELPFHHAEFVNKCLKLAERWGIRQAILAGDTLHFDSLSSFDKNWRNEQEGGITAKAERELMEAIKKLPSKYQGSLMDTIVVIGERLEEDGVSTELAIARKVLHRLSDQFDLIDFVIGNHDGRLLAALHTTLDVKELMRLLQLKEPKWRIAPYYYSILNSGGQKFQIEHPNSAGKGTSRKYAPKFRCHVLVGHNHHFLFTTDISGEYICSEIGCCVDEERLPYASQRHNAADAHILGAAIVRDGNVHFLNKFTDWPVLESWSG